VSALIAAAYQITDDYNRARDLAIRAVRPLHGCATLINVNDVRGHAAVLALLDKRQRRCKATTPGGSIASDSR